MPESNLSILIVDDEEDIRFFLKEVLEAEGFDVKTASNAFKALELIEECFFSIVLSDIAMPEMDGYELFNKAKLLYPNLPIIMMTGFGYDPSHVLVRLRKNGECDVLFKPFDNQKLLKKLKIAIEKTTLNKDKQ